MWRQRCRSTRWWRHEKRKTTPSYWTTSTSSVCLCVNSSSINQRGGTLAEGLWSSELSSALQLCLSYLFEVFFFLSLWLYQFLVIMLERTAEALIISHCKVPITPFPPCTLLGPLCKEDFLRTILFGIIEKFRLIFLLFDIGNPREFWHLWANLSIIISSLKSFLFFLDLENVPVHIWGLCTPPQEAQSSYFFSYETCAKLPSPPHPPFRRLQKPCRSSCERFFAFNTSSVPAPVKHSSWSMMWNFQKGNTLTIINTAGVKMSELDTEVAWSRNYLLNST